LSGLRGCEVRLTNQDREKAQTDQKTAAAFCAFLGLTSVCRSSV
jgi:hypothetical protein